MRINAQIYYKLLLNCVLHCDLQIPDCEHSSDTDLESFTLRYHTKSAEGNKDECCSDRSQESYFGEYSNLTDDSEYEHSTEESETCPKEFLPPSPRNLAEDYEDEYTSDISPEIRLGKYNPRSLIKLTESFSEEDSYDGSAETSSEDSLPQSPIKLAKSCEELHSKMSSQYSPLSISDYEYSNEYLSATSGISLLSISAMNQSDVSSLYMSAVENMNTSLFEDMQGGHVSQSSDEDISSTESKANTAVTTTKLQESFRKSPKERTMPERLADNIPRSNCGEANREGNWQETSMPITPGVKIYEFSPFVCVLNADRTRTHCNCCFKKIVNRKECEGCWLVCYCSEKCQDEHYLIHGIECLLNSQIFCLPKYARFMAHLMWKLMDPDSKQIYDIVGGRRLYYDDLEFYELPFPLNKCPQFRNYMEIQFNLLREYFDYFCEFSEFWILFSKICGHLKIITDPEDGELGIGIYFGLSAFRYSYHPTANVVFLGNVAQVIASTDLKADIPGMVTLRFPEGMNPWYTSRDNLVVYNGSFCSCTRCKEVWAENLQIPSSKDSTLIMFEAAKYVYARHPVVFECDVQNQYMGACEIIRKLESVTKQDNRILQRILEIAAKTSRKLHRFDEAIDYYSKLVFIQSNFLGPYDLKTVDSELKLALLQFQIDSSSDSETNLLKVLKKVSKIFGYEHPYVQTVEEKYRKLDKCGFKRHLL